MKIKIPKDYVPPSGVKEGQEFKEIITAKFKDGNLILVSIGENEAKLNTTKSFKEAVLDGESSSD